MGLYIHKYFSAHMAKVFLQSLHEVTEIQGVLYWRKSYRNPKINVIAAITFAAWNMAAKLC